MKFIKEVKKDQATKFVKDIAEGLNVEAAHTFECEESVAAELGTFSCEDFGSLKACRLFLLYPFVNILEFEVECSTLHELIDEIRRAYRFIYEDADRFGVRCHGIGGLYIERIFIDEEGIVFPFIGS